MAADPTKKSTFIEEARQKQIIDTAIRTIAARGFGQTTLADIAREAGVSTGVITYHFQGKDDLIEQCIAKLFELPNAFVVTQVDAADGHAAKIRAYIRANIQHIRENREHTVALIYALSAFESGDSQHRFSAKQHIRIRKYVQRILEDGQRDGVFRSFSTTAMAQVLFGALEGVMLQWVLDPKLDLDRFATELIEMTDHHILAD